MGFRNPVLTAVDPVARDAAAAAQSAADAAAVAIIPGSRLAADAIDGKTITGALIRTAPGGTRVEIASPPFAVTNGYAAAAKFLADFVDMRKPESPGELSLTVNLASDNGAKMYSALTRTLLAGSDAGNANTDPTLIKPAVALDVAGQQGYTGGVLSGTYEGIVNLQGNRLQWNGSDVNRQRVWSSSRTGNASDVIGTANTTLLAVTINNAPAGDWLLHFRCVISNAASAAGNQSITVNGAGVGDGSPRADCGTAGIRFPFTESWGYTHTGGTMTIRGLYQAAATTGSSATVWSQGTYITATYLGPRS